MLEPRPVPPPLAPRIDEPVKHEGLQDLIPARALATGREFAAPKFAEAQLLPQLAAPPARAPLARRVLVLTEEGDGLAPGGFLHAARVRPGKERGAG